MKRYIRCGTDRFRFENQILGVLNKILPQPLQVSSVSVDSSVRFNDKYEATVYVEDAGPRLSEIDITDFYISNDYEGAATFLSSCIQDAIDSGEMILLEDSPDFLSNYQKYFTKIDEVIQNVASKYNSDMRLDFNRILSDPRRCLDYVKSIMGHDHSIDLCAYGYNMNDMIMSHAFGLDATQDEWHRYNLITPEGTVIEGPYSFYYKGDDLSMSLKHFGTALKHLEIAVNDYFKDFNQKLIDSGVQTGFSDSQDTRDTRKPKWASILSQLKEDYDDGIDPFYDDSDAGEYILSICNEVENSLHYYVEPSIQAGQGGVWIYDEAHDNETIVEGYDFQTFDEEIGDLALSSTSMLEFKRKYKEYLLNLQ